MRILVPMTDVFADLVLETNLYRALPSRFTPPAWLKGEVRTGRTDREDDCCLVISPHSRTYLGEACGLWPGRHREPRIALTATMTGRLP